ncbi:hypothetical protein KY5_3439 [Streptomyces formicae]|uniref:Gram-positive cocci surface proteins LPxTG domain-containing protein n=2 Tax=Streptomyces formicae TaxID=1616117 RepID=A0A291QAD0_9ACTN|nr:hypothetical protein KY5_3439 [Streptomyces formicae]
MAAIATAAAMAPAFLGAAPAAAAETVDAAVAAPDRSAAEDSDKESTALPEDATEGAAPPADEVDGVAKADEPGAEPSAEPSAPVADEPNAKPTTGGGPPAAAPMAPSASPAPRSAKARDSRVPGLRLEGLPEALEAGGDWANFSVVIDNPHDEGQVWNLDMAINTDGAQLYGDDLRVQVQVDGTWHDAVVSSPPDLGNYDLDLLVEFSLPMGRTTVPLRIRAAADAPLIDFFVGSRVYDEEVQSDDAYWVWSKIVVPAEGGEKPGDGEQSEGGEQPEDGQNSGDGEKPEDGQKPGDDEKPEDSSHESGDDPKPGSGHGPGAGHSGSGEMNGDDGGDTAGPAGPAVPAAPKGGSAATVPVAEDHGAAADTTRNTAAPGASLAETGSDAAAGWMLGAGGVSIALGTALATTANRRRRTHP